MWDVGCGMWDVGWDGCDVVCGCCVCGLNPTRLSTRGEGGMCGDNSLSLSHFYVPTWYFGFDECEMKSVYAKTG